LAARPKKLLLNVTLLLQFFTDTTIYRKVPETAANNGGIFDPDQSFLLS
jgi:hypothetical protein